MKASFFIKLFFFSVVVSDSGTVVEVLTSTGSRAELPCRYEYEDRGEISEMSLQWRGPEQRLLCHYIKHKSFQNCTPGYSLDYVPGKIALVIQEVTAADLGTHVCSVSKRHEFTDFVTKLLRRPKSSTEAPNTNGNHSGNKGNPLFLFVWTLSMCFWG